MFEQIYNYVASWHPAVIFVAGCLMILAFIFLCEFLESFTKNDKN